MKKSILLFFIISLIPATYADTVISIDHNKVITLDNKNILSIDVENSVLLSNLEFALKHDLNIELVLNKTEEEIKGVSFTKNFTTQKATQFENIDPLFNYTPTVITRPELPSKLFESLIGATKWRSQCFNRAHIWAKEIFNMAEVYSTKIFIFYTKKYRNEIGGKWWFHVAPMIDTKKGQLVLDKEFFKEPVSREKWTNRFSAEKACKISTSINEYYDEVNQREEYCNVIVASMYYRSPRNLKDLADSSIEKAVFLNSDIKAAAKNIYWGWREVYERLQVSTD